MTIISYHGLMAYSGKRKTIHELLAQVSSIETMHKQAELCGSDTLVGDLGLILKSKCTGAFSADCWSYVDNGLRAVNPDGSYQVFKNKGDISEGFIFASEYCDFYRQSKNGISQDTALNCSIEKTRKYTEFFISASEVLAIVVTKKADAKTLKQARVLARKFGVFVTLERTSYVDLVKQFSDYSENYDFRLDYLYELQESLELGVV